MSIACVRGGHECNGCLCCQEEPETIDKCWCGGYIHADESYYDGVCEKEHKYGF